MRLRKDILPPMLIAITVPNKKYEKNKNKKYQMKVISYMSVQFMIYHTHNKNELVLYFYV